MIAAALFVAALHWRQTAAASGTHSINRWADAPADEVEEDDEDEDGDGDEDAEVDVDETLLDDDADEMDFATESFA